MSLHCCDHHIIQKAKTKRKVSRTYKKLEKMSRIIAPRASMDFVRGIQKFKKKIKESELASAFEKQDYSKVIEVIPWNDLHDDLNPFKKQVADSFIGASRLVIPSIPAPENRELRFDMNNPRLVNFINQRTGVRIQEVNADTHFAVRSAVMRSFNEAKTPLEVANEIKTSIGLDERRAGALIKYKANLMDQGLKESRVTDLADAYEARLLQSRAMGIARSEVRNAVNNGQLSVWKEGANQGLFDKQKARKAWVIDGNPCEICEPMDGEEVELDGFWTLDDGTMCYVPNDAHPNCECGMELVFDGNNESEEDQVNEDQES